MEKRLTFRRLILFCVTHLTVSVSGGSIQAAAAGFDPASFNCQWELFAGEHSIGSKDLPRFVDPETAALFQSPMAIQAQEIRQSIDKAAKLSPDLPDPLVQASVYVKILPFFKNILKSVSDVRRTAINEALEHFWSTRPPRAREKRHYDPLNINDLEREAEARQNTNQVTSYWLSSFIERVLLIRDLDRLHANGFLNDASIGHILSSWRLNRAKSLFEERTRNGQHKDEFVGVPAFNLWRPIDFFPYWQRGLSPECITDCAIVDPYDGNNPEWWGDRTAAGVFHHDGFHTSLLNDVAAKAELLLHDYFDVRDSESKWIQMTRRLLSKATGQRMEAPKYTGRKLISNYLDRVLKVLDCGMDADQQHFLTNVSWMFVHEFDYSYVEFIVGVNVAMASDLTLKADNSEREQPWNIALVKTALKNEFSSPIALNGLRYGLVRNRGWIYPESWRQVEGTSIKNPDYAKIERALDLYFEVMLAPEAEIQRRCGRLK